MVIKFQDLVEKHGEAKALQIGAAICEMHGGMSLQDFKQHRGGIDISGCKEGDQRKIENLIAEDGPETAKSLAKAHNRDALVAMAKEAGLDGNSFTDKTELAQAIIDKRGK